MKKLQLKIKIKWERSLSTLLVSLCMFCVIACKTDSKQVQENTKANEVVQTQDKGTVQDEVTAQMNDQHETTSKEIKDEIKAESKTIEAKKEMEKEMKEKMPEKSVEVPKVSKPKTMEDVQTKVEEKVVEQKSVEVEKIMEEQDVLIEDMQVVEEEEKLMEPEPESILEAEPEPVVAEGPNLDHGKFDKLLNTYVSSSGKVNYKGLTNAKSSLMEYTSDLSNNYPDNSAPKNEKLAYFINAYNAYTLLLIVDNYPLASIMDLDGGKPWDRKWINLGGNTFSLNDIEHNILRKQLNEPRVHFAVNCAAKSCPPIYNKAFSESNTQSFLNQRTKAFINDNTQNSFSDNTLALSKIFEWYKEDFGDLLSYINKYRNSKVPGDTKITYKEYDWKLNE